MSAGFGLECYCCREQMTRESIFSRRRRNAGVLGCWRRGDPAWTAECGTVDGLPEEYRVRVTAFVADAVPAGEMATLRLGLEGLQEQVMIARHPVGCVGELVGSVS